MQIKPCVMIVVDCAIRSAVCLRTGFNFGAALVTSKTLPHGRTKEVVEVCERLGGDCRGVKLPSEAEEEPVKAVYSTQPT